MRASEPKPRVKRGGSNLEAKSPIQFTAIGEILVDFTPVVESGTTVGFHMHPGGSPYNVAVGLARLGAQAEFAGKASTDLFGRFLVAHLEREGVGTRFLSRTAAPSTLAFVAIQNGEPTFSFYGEGAADTQLMLEDLPQPILQTHFLHFGSISLLREPTATTIAELVERVRGRAVLSCDPNIRPALIADAGAYHVRLIGLLQATDIVKISATDLRWVDPHRPLEAAAGALLEQGPVLVVVTQGASGAYARTATVEMRIPAHHVEVVDTIGAGDAFTSGLLFRLGNFGVKTRSDLEEVQDHELEASLRFASVAAALTCTRPGADPPRYSEVEGSLRREG